MRAKPLSDELPQDAPSKLRDGLLALNGLLEDVSDDLGKIRKRKRKVKKQTKQK